MTPSLFPNFYKQTFITSIRTNTLLIFYVGFSLVNIKHVAVFFCKDINKSTVWVLFLTRQSQSINVCQTWTFHIHISCFHEIRHCHYNPLHCFSFTHQLLSEGLGFVFKGFFTFFIFRKQQNTQKIFSTSTRLFGLKPPQWVMLSSMIYLNVLKICKIKWIE